MRVSQRLDHTLRGLVELAASPPGRAITAGEVAGRLSIPRRFLEQQFTAMAKRGLVTCQRGAGGGCALARPATAISVGDVARAVQGQVLDVPHLSSSAASEVWADAASRLGRALDAVTLADIAARQAEMDRAASAMYYI